jgi:hypothetical protein
MGMPDRYSRELVHSSVIDRTVKEASWHLSERLNQEEFMMIGWRRFACVLGLAATLANCSGIPPVPGYATVPLVLQLSSGEHLKGSVTTRLLRRTFYATDGRLACSGNFHPSGAGTQASTNVSCSNGQRGVGPAAGTSSFAGAGTFQMGDGSTAAFQYGDAIHHE